MSKMSARSTTDASKELPLVKTTAAGPKQSFTRKSSFQLKQRHQLIMNDVPAKTQTSTNRKSFTRSRLVPLLPKQDPAQAMHANKEKPKYDKDATEKFNSMLDGELKNLPPLKKSVVRIFLSSTFTDMREERNILAKQVYPQLREYCALHGLDLQVVDMRWGVTEDCQNDHSVEKLCLLEIANCQRVSKGPNFVVLSGDKYGFRPIPVELKADMFEILLFEANKLNIANRGLLNEWFKLDENSLPKLYILQPIRSKFTFFADFSPGCNELRKRDTDAWWKTYTALQDILRKSADEAIKDKKISEAERHQLYISVTECEIQDGILKASDVNSHCLVYKRHLNNLNNKTLTDQNASRHIDVITTEKGSYVDQEVAALRESLFVESIQNKLSKQNIRSYSVDWLPGGLNPVACSPHKIYLDQLCSDFITDCKQLIDNAVERNRKLIQMENYYSDYDDTIHHLQLCLSKCEAFCGQEQTLNAARTYILNESNRKPLVIYGQSGAGKTSIMAMIMKSVPVWLKGKPHLKLIRFLGTTPRSNIIYDVMFSVLGQLSDACDMIMSPVNYTNMKTLTDFFPRHLRNVASTCKIPVIILLDSVDQLYPAYNAYAMDWLPTSLPLNVKLIISTIPKEHGILDNLQKHLTDPECYIEVPLLSEETGKLIAQTYLKFHKRLLTEQQMSLLLTKFKQAPSPLFLKLMLDEAKMWHSYTPVTYLDLAPTVKEAITKLFQNLENKFGYVLVSHALGYITIGLTGLTEFEIEDVLSCDDDVLNEVYNYHDPPVPGIIRIPPVLWARIHFDLKGYLVERISCGKNTLNWYHRQFIESAIERYTSDGKDVQLHKNMTDMYLQETGIQRTIILKKRNNLEIRDADRQVTPQPFEAQNQRKLACLPYHLIRGYKAIGSDIAKSAVLCNFKFLCMKIAAFSVSALIKDLAEFTDANKDDEVEILMNFLSSVNNDLTVPKRLAVCLLGYIKHNDYQTCLAKLLQQARNYLYSQSMPILIPVFACLSPRHDISSALLVSLSRFNAILALWNNFVLLEVQRLEETADNLKCWHTLYNCDNQKLTPLELPDKTSVGNQYALNRDYVYYVNSMSLVAYNFREKTVGTLLFNEMIAKWDKKTQPVQKFISNENSTFGAITFNQAIILVNLSNMKCIQTFYPGKSTAKFENCLILNDARIIAVGTYNCSLDDDQGPEKQSFICAFTQDKKEHFALYESEKSINSSVMAFADHETWFLTTESLNCSQKTEHSHTKLNKKLEAIDTLILRFKMIHDFQPYKISIPSVVQGILGNPDEAKALAHAKNGRIYLLDIEKNEIMLEIHLYHPVIYACINWKEHVCLLSSPAGNVVLYDLANKKQLSVFSAHVSGIKDIKVLDKKFVTLGMTFDFHSWSLTTMIKDATLTNLDKLGSSLLQQTNVTVIAVSSCGSKLITFTDDRLMKIWEMHSQKLLCQFNMCISADTAATLVDHQVLVMDKTLEKLTVIDIETGIDTFCILSSILYVKSFTVDDAGGMIHIFSAPSQEKEQIDIVSVQHKKIYKTFHLQKGLTYENIEMILTRNCRYLVIQSHISNKEYLTIKALWKTGGFPKQPHRYKFTAVDVSQGSGALIPCFHQLSEIPILGVGMQPYKGNTMLITTRRWVIFWDIPTGRCDQKPCRQKKTGMFYRPEWLGQECTGTSTVFKMSHDLKFLAVGSEDGYMFIYEAESGLPRGMKKPATKHNSEVQRLDISPDSHWVASSCQSGFLKLWNAKSGEEFFSLGLGAEVQNLTFTPDSKKLIVFTKNITTRLLIFDVYSGTKDNSNSSVCCRNANHS